MVRGSQVANVGAIERNIDSAERLLGLPRDLDVRERSPPLRARTHGVHVAVHLHGNLEPGIRQDRGCVESRRVPFVRATGLLADYDAVRAGLTLPWSSGAVEGNVTRIKAIKRQMYGRANFDLLRRRVLLAH